MCTAHHASHSITRHYSSFLPSTCADDGKEYNTAGTPEALLPPDMCSDV
jgi:hypothetical protein